MDWVFTNTTLSLINWLKVQEIYAQLYLVKVQRNRERVSRVGGRVRLEGCRPTQLFLLS